MRPAIVPEGIVEHVGLWTNVGPVPVAEAMFGMAMSRVLMAACRLGLFEELSRGPASPTSIAERRGLDEAGIRHILDCLCALRHVERNGSAYSFTRRARPWLDAASPTYIGPFLEFNYDQWEWWSGMEDAIRSGRGHEIHAYDEGDPRWERYIRAMFLLSRFSAPEVARKLRLPPNPTKVLDVAGGHGWFAAELCNRHPALHGTVLDLPGSARIGRRIIADNGMSDRVTHVEGDMMTADLGGPYDATLCFQIIHHLSPEQNVALFKRIRAALNPGGVLAVMDYFAPPPHKRPDSAALLGLHFYLTSSAATYSVADLKDWLREAGFGGFRKVRLLRVPVQTLVEAPRT